MILRRLSFLVAAVLLAAAAFAPAAFTTAFDPVRTEIDTRKSSLVGASDRTSQNQLAALSRALAKLDTLDASASPSLARDVAAAIAVFPILEKAFRLEFPKGAVPTGALGAAVAGAATALKTEVEAGASTLNVAIGPLPPSKLRTSAQKQADIAGRALGAADVQTAPSRIAKLLRPAQAAVLKGLAIAAKAPVRNTVTATIGTAAFVGENNYVDYDLPDGLLDISANADTAALGGFASFDFSPFAASVTGPGDYPITGTMRTGADPGNNTQYSISSGTMHLTTFDAAAQRVGGTFTLTVAGHPERSSVDGAFDFYSIRVHQADADETASRNPVARPGLEIPG